MDKNLLIALMAAAANKGADLTFDQTPTDGSSNPVTSNGIYDAVEDVREVAQGKTATYVVDDTVDTAFNSQNDTITVSAAITDINKGSIALADLRIGDNVYVTQIDVPDRWVSTINSTTSGGVTTVTSVVLSKLETAKVPVIDVQVAGTSVVNSGTGIASIPVGYTTTAPSADNTSGALIIVVLSSEPATKYNGYLYVITAS